MKSLGRYESNGQNRREKRLGTAFTGLFLNHKVKICQQVMNLGAIPNGNFGLRGILFQFDMGSRGQKIRIIFPMFSVDLTATDIKLKVRCFGSIKNSTPYLVLFEDSQRKRRKDS